MNLNNSYSLQTKNIETIMLVDCCPTLDTLNEQLKSAWQKHLTGRLYVQAGTEQWSLFFKDGLFVCPTGGLHKWRRARRFLSKYCPHILFKHSLLGTELFLHKSEDYHLLARLVRQGKVIKQQATYIIQDILIEVLFDILQQEEKGQLIFTVDCTDVIDDPLILINPEQALRQARRNWEIWTAAGLTEICPNSAPLLRNAQQLRKQVRDRAYENIIEQIDGRKSIRDLAFLLNQSLLSLSVWLSKYINKKLLKLVQLSDISPIACFNEKQRISPAIRASNRANGMLISNVNNQKYFSTSLKPLIENSATSRMPTLLKIKSTYNKPTHSSFLIRFLVFIFLVIVLNSSFLIWDNLNFNNYFISYLRENYVSRKLKELNIFLSGSRDYRIWQDVKFYHAIKENSITLQLESQQTCPGIDKDEDCR